MPRVAPTLLLFSALSFACSDDETGTEPESASAALEDRGRYLVDHVSNCTDCHTPLDSMGAPILSQYLAGAECFNRLENGSCLNTSNLTNDETGLMNRTDAQIKRMIRDGIRPAAIAGAGEETMHPVMPSYVYHNMSDSDLDAVVAYLRKVPGVEHDVPRSGPEFNLDRSAIALPEDLIPQPMPGYEQQEAALRGRYLAAEVGPCIICHSGHINPILQWLDYDAFFSGGEVFDLGLPALAISGNITSDPETGIGDWSVEDIVKVIKQGIDKQGNGTCPPVHGGPMASLAGMTDADALDIAHYIKSLPPIMHAMSDECTFPPM